MRLAKLLIILGVISFTLSSCTKKHSEIMVAKYADDKIQMDEFEKVYAKNAGGYEEAKDDSIEQYENFLDLYVNFKMKLRDAKVRGYDNIPELKNELQDYKEKVADTYLIEKKVVNPALKDLHNKRKYEIRVSHLMIRPDSLSDEEAKSFAQSLIDSINNGGNFEELVSKYSADFYSKPTGGDIYYITAGTIIPEFEEAAYNTKVGEVYTKPLKTKYGYHILKVTEKRERKPAVRASHILIDFKDKEGKLDSAAAKAFAQSILDSINNGADFAELAIRHSEDPGSGKNGGDLGFFERRRMVKEFDETAFNLEIGEVSELVKTNFGYHIIKVTDYKKVGSFEEEKENLRKIHKRSRYEADYQNYLTQLKDRFNYNINEEILTAIAAETDTMFVGNNFESSNIKEKLQDSTVITAGDIKVNVDSLFKYIESVPGNRGRAAKLDFIKSSANKLGEEILLSKAADLLEEEDEEFADLMADYRNGIYVFKLQDEEVWSKINVDTSKLREFYELNKDKYRWDDRVSFNEISIKSDSLADFIYAELQNGVEFDSLAVKYRDKSSKNKSGKYLKVVVEGNKSAEEAFKLETPGDIAKVKRENGYSIIKLVEKDPARTKTFEEAKAEAASEFQESESKRLENEYIQSLKDRYNPKYYYENLEKAFQDNK